LKVEIKVSADIKEPYAVLYTNDITDDIQKISAFLQSQERVITANDEGRIIILKPEEIFMVRIEESEAVIYCKNKQYMTNKKLYELEEQLGKGFLRISKASIVNLKLIDCVEPSFNGMMLLIMKNGCKDYISRKYLPEFKKYLGI